MRLRKKKQRMPCSSRTRRSWATAWAGGRATTSRVREAPQKMQLKKQPSIKRCWAARRPLSAKPRSRALVSSSGESSRRGLRKP